MVRLKMLRYLRHDGYNIYKVIDKLLGGGGLLHFLYLELGFYCSLRYGGVGLGGLCI